MDDEFFETDWTLKEVRSERGVEDVDVEVSFRGFAVGGTDQRTTGAPATTTPSPTAPTTPTGALGFPQDNQQFMQTLEVRGKNGHDEPVETVYALVLSGGSLPRIVALDDPKMYVNATRRSVHYYVDPMAEEVARQCTTTPDAIVKIHTHPSGSTEPSDKDKEGTEKTKEIFEEKLGSRSFEFLQGIHAYKSATVSTDQMRDPTAAGNSVSWNGERFRHTLALFDAHFRSGQVVELV